MSRKVNLGIAAVFVLVIIVAFVWPPRGDIFASLQNEPIRTSFILVSSFIIALVVYRLIANVIRAAILRYHGTEGDVKMIVGFWRVSVIFLTILSVLSFYYQLGVIAAVIGAFGGMFLGWSLQQPVSGFAAWVLVTIKRPFRVGDRIQLPSHGLVGDVVDVGPMYTVLNQVGGAVGSEEPVGRHVLIPNSMLFGNLVINYTPKIQEEEVLPVLDEKRATAYILDEVVARITYDSDWKAAEDILLDAAREVTSQIIEETGKEPYTRSDMYDYGVYLRLRYMTLATDRPRMKYEIERRIFEEFQKNENVDFAIPYVYSARKGAQMKRQAG
jgi:small-conductance mechanosensitive channel